MVVEVVVEVVVDVAVVGGRAEVVVIDAETDSVVGVVISFGATSTEDKPQAAARRLLNTKTQANVRISNRLASGSTLIEDHPPML